MKTNGWQLWVASALLVCFVPATPSAQTLTIEAEDYEQCLELGGYPIQRLPESGCSGGYILFGLDTPGEWTEYEVSAPVLGTYTVAVKCRGTYNRNYGLNLILTPAGGGYSQTIELSFVGSGFG